MCHSRHSPAAHRADHGEAGCPSVVHRGPQWSRYPPAACGGSHAGASNASEGGCDTVGSPVLGQAPARTCGPVERGDHAGAHLLAVLVTPRGTHAGEACSWRTAPHGKDPFWRRFVKNCSLWKGSTMEKFVENCLPCVGCHAGVREECEESSL